MKNSYVPIFLILSLLISCQKEDKSSVPDTVVTFTVGQSYGGGIIFYVDATGKHGLIAPTTDQGTGVWGCSSASINGADGIVLGTGPQNTADIVKSCTTAGIAAKLCDDLVLNNYTDWYLPSKDELGILMNNQSVVGGFKSGYYWSSTEGTTGLAWQKKDNSGNEGFATKDYSDYVRAIRSF